jgi:hypothetical protein
VDETIIVVVAVLIFGWALVSSALARANVTAPLVFTLAGFIGAALAPTDAAFMLTVDLEFNGFVEAFVAGIALVKPFCGEVPKPMMTSRR